MRAWMLAVVPLLSAALSHPAVAGEFYRQVGAHWQKDSDRGYFRIFNLYDGDAVNLQAGPSFEAPILKPMQNGAIVASDGISHWGGPISWQRVSLDHTDGWVPTRHLKRVEPRMLPATDIPVAGSCSGHTPIWSLRWSEKRAHLSLFPGNHELGIDAGTTAAELRASLLTATSAELSAELLHTGEACSLVQGNSLVGVSGYLIVTESGAKRLLAGCCEATAEAFAP